MKKTKICTLAVVLWLPLAALAGIQPQATYMENDIETTDWKNITGDAPLHVRFAAHSSNLDAGAAVEWHLRHRTRDTHLTRYEEEFDFDFMESGVTDVYVLVRQDNEVVDSAGITVTISESLLEMPNAFTPNGDGQNEYYQAKSNSKSIVSFHAYIFNRWGQKLYEWTDCTDEKAGWDGNFHGQPVSDGVYFVLVKAMGSDGREYNIRRDVNLIRHFNELSAETGGTP